MIECWIEGDSTAFPALVPVHGSTLPIPSAPEGTDPSKWRTEWIANIQKMQTMGAALGWTPGDLLSISVPGGASRHSSVRLLMASPVIPDLYGASDGTDEAWTLKWREDANAALNSMRVWLRPFRPLFWPDTQGVVVVEAVDVRWWWQFVAASDVTTGSLTFDGRYLGVAADGTTGSAANALGTVKAAVEALLTALGLSITLPGGFAPSSAALLCVNNLLANYSGNAALLLDMVLAECGWALQYLPSDGTYQIVEIGGDITTMGTWMNSTQRLACGGPGPTADPTNSPDTLLDLYNGYAASSPPGVNYIKNLGPNASGTVIALGTRESVQVFDNQSGATTPTTDYQATSPVGNPRPLTDKGVAVLRTSAVLPDNTTNLSGSYPWLTNTLSTLQAYRAANYLSRQSVCCGRTVFAGWLCPPRGSFRQTDCRWTVADMGGTVGWAPVLLTRADWEDWTLGPDGRMQMDPRQLVIGRGNLSVVNLNGGGTMLSVAPPQVRTFKAMILASPVTCENEWRAKYKWQEVEPNEDDICDGTRWEGEPSMLRAWDDDAENPNYAENDQEYDNIYGNYIRGVGTLADYPNATFGWSPVDPGLVTMTETIPTVFPGADYPLSRKPVYTFSQQNNYTVDCNA